MAVKIHRRRFISILAAAAGLSLAPAKGRAAPRSFRWTGMAMGAEASITLYHSDQPAAEALITDCVAEMARMEGLFSLFRRDSLLTRLNRDKRLDGAPEEFLALVAQARRLSEISDGAFDATVQPLWDLYAGHFARADADPDGPPPAAVEAARARVGWSALTVDGRSVRLGRPDMAATFNGIAPGCMTDRVVELLRRRGIGDVLVDLGEMRAIGGHPDGRPWRVGVADPNAPARTLERLDLRDQAVASSGGYGTVFDSRGRFHHLFDPHSGRPQQRWAGITVTAPTAALADGLTKAIMLASLDRAAEILKAGGGTAALLIAADGSIQRIRA